MTDAPREAIDEYQRWHVVHEWQISKSGDVRKARIIELYEGKRYALELGFVSKVDGMRNPEAPIGWVPFARYAFRGRISHQMLENVIEELGKLAAARKAEMEHAMRVIRQDDFLASLKEGDPVEVQISGTCADMLLEGTCEHKGHTWIPATFVRLDERSWVNVRYSNAVAEEWGIHPDDPDDTLIMPGHVRAPGGTAPTEANDGRERPMDVIHKAFELLDGQGTGEHDRTDVAEVYALVAHALGRKTAYEQ